MNNKRFSKNDAGFVCVKCGKHVPPLEYSSRDHCNECLYSVHVDIFPGDRSNSCGGNLIPIATETNPKKGFVILYKCEKCGIEHRNSAARDDNSELIIKLTNPEYYSQTIKQYGEF